MLSLQDKLATIKKQEKKAKEEIKGKKVGKKSKKDK